LHQVAPDLAIVDDFGVPADVVRAARFGDQRLQERMRAVVAPCRRDRLGDGYGVRRSSTSNNGLDRAPRQPMHRREKVGNGQQVGNPFVRTRLEHHGAQDGAFRLDAVRHLQALGF